MKRLKAFPLMMLSIFITITSFSQSGPAAKPTLFNNFPASIACNEPELERIFSITEGQQIAVVFQNGFTVNGTVTTNIVRYSNLQSVVIKSPQFDNAVFSISKVTNTDRSITYTGRIINQNYFDGYELKKDASGNYTLSKIETDKTLHTCNQQ
ncbi:MAG: hypothetical protein IPP48_07100 [Chitinophagaceae bacterium]|nr:hypothetical protein [Chitinophagaceae bacterium]